MLLANQFEQLQVNLDQDDERYDEIINQLIVEQNKINTVVQSQVKILESPILKFHESIFLIADNQETIKNKISEIDNIIKYMRPESV